MQRQRRIDIQLYKEVAVEKKRREINLVYEWKLNFWPFFPLLHTERFYLTTLFQKRLLKQGKNYSDDSQTMQFASSRSLLSLHRLFSVSSKTYCKNYEHIHSQTWKANNLLFVWNANNLSLQVKLGPEIPFSLILKVVLIKWDNVCPNLYRQYKIQTADCCWALFSPCKWQRDNNSPIVFLTPPPLKTMVCSLHFVLSTNLYIKDHQDMNIFLFFSFSNY